MNNYGDDKFRMVEEGVEFKFAMQGNSKLVIVMFTFF